MGTEFFCGQSKYWIGENLGLKKFVPKNYFIQLKWLLQKKFDSMWMVQSSSFNVGGRMAGWLAGWLGGPCR